MLTSKTSNAEFVQRFNVLEAERDNLEWIWDLIERWVIPGRGRFFLEGHDQEDSIDWRHPELFDNVAVMAARNLAASMHSGITNPANRWYNLRFRDDELNKEKLASEWLEDCSDACWLSLQNSNFNHSAGELYQDDVAFGTAVMIHEERDGDAGTFEGHMFRTAMLREMYFEMDWDDMPSVVFRKKGYTASQIVAKFGKDNVPDKIRDMADRQQQSVEKHDVLQVLYIRDDKRKSDTSGLLAANERPVGCRYILLDVKATIQQDGKDETGYYEMPVYIPRFNKTAGSKFGHSPAIDCLADIRTLQKYVELSLRAGEKAVDPTMLAVSRGVIGDVDLTPGGITVVRNKDSLQALESRARFDVSNEQMDDLRRRIERAFFVDQLELKESPAMTATEVNARVQLMQRLLGPSLSRLTSDWLDPLVKRTFWMMYRKGALPPFPEELASQEVNLDIEYIGTLPRSQRMEDVEAIQQWLGIMNAVATVKPEALDAINEVGIAHISADRLGVPAEGWRSQDEIDKVRKQREEAQQRQEQIGEAGAVAEIQNTEADTRQKLQVVR